MRTTEHPHYKGWEWFYRVISGVDLKTGSTIIPARRYRTWMA
jgi:hypothetical protein